MDIIIPCAGEGKRLGLGIPKILVPICGIPLIKHITQPWEEGNRFIFVVNPNNHGGIIENAPPNSAIVLQEEPKGITDAIMKAAPEVKGDKFLVTLGDCIYRGRFMNQDFFSTNLGIGVWKTKEKDFNEVRQNYAVSVGSDGKVTRLVEKPKWASRNCGMGVYFLNSILFKYILSFPNLGLTDLLQTMVEWGEDLYPIWFFGKYVNINYKEDIKKAEEMLHETN